MTDSCERCGDSVVHGAPERFQFRAYDLADSTGAYYAGRLCSPCWSDLVRFMAEDPCDPRWSTA